MYIDIHVHANPWSPDGFNLDAVSDWMTQNRVERCIILPLKGTLPRDEAEQALQRRNYGKYAGRIDHFCLLPADECGSREEMVQRLRLAKQEGAIGYGEHYGAGLPVDAPDNMRLFSACAEAGLPVLLHLDKENNKDEAGLPHLENAVRSNPACTFIGHGPGWWSQITDGTLDRLLGTHPNLYGDLSAQSGARAIGTDRPSGKAFLIRHAGKLMFGTDSGSWSGKEPAVQFTLLESLDLPPGVKAAIYRGNAERLFGF